MGVRHRLRLLFGIVRCCQDLLSGSTILGVMGRYNTSERDFELQWAFLNAEGEELSGIPGAALDALRDTQFAFNLLDALRDSGKNFDSTRKFWRPFLKDGQMSAQPIVFGQQNSKLVAGTREYAK